MVRTGAILLLIALTRGSFAASSDTLFLSALDLSKVRQGWGRAQKDLSVSGNPLSISGRRFDRGVGTHAASVLWVTVNGGAERFQAFAGVDDSAKGDGSVIFKVIGDGRILWKSNVMRHGQRASQIDVDLRGVMQLVLQVGEAGDGIGNDHADWADARLIVSGEKPKTASPPLEEATILTPPPGPVPHINGPAVVGCRPGNPFLYRIPCTGERPMRFSAEGLPPGLSLDQSSGIITGSAPPRGEYRVVLNANNGKGASTRPLRVVSGERLALTPPMGWNHWYTHYGRITDALMRQAADVMVSSGMADVGYQYVNIDDCWMNAPKNEDPIRVGPLRDARGDILPNKHFPDMKALTAYIHAKGLKAGLYTSPGPLTCAGFSGSYQHEARDARQFAEWGFDFLKYDWCSYGTVAKGDDSRAALEKPYALMGELLKQQRRDIVFNLCQYGMGNVWEWGAMVGAHCWRTAGDLGYELDRVFEVALANAEHRAWSRPGSWNDPDYIQIGSIGDARANGLPIACPLSPNEQYAFMSLWSLMAAPLFFSGDMGQLDPFTVGVLCNPEVIDIDQDPVGQSAEVAMITDETFLMVKSLEDGGKAVGLFNRGEFPARVAASWAVIGISGAHTVRDVWRQKDLGRYDGEFATTVPRHGVFLIRCTK
jgi:alpha-galactosidase